MEIKKEVGLKRNQEGNLTKKQVYMGIVEHRQNLLYYMHSMIVKGIL